MTQQTKAESYNTAKRRAEETGSTRFTLHRCADGWVYELGWNTQAGGWNYVQAEDGSWKAEGSEPR